MDGTRSRSANDPPPSTSPLGRRAQLAPIHGSTENLAEPLLTARPRRSARAIRIVTEGASATLARPAPSPPAAPPRPPPPRRRPRPWRPWPSRARARQRWSHRHRDPGAPPRDGAVVPHRRGADQGLRRGRRRRPGRPGAGHHRPGRRRRPPAVLVLRPRQGPPRPGARQDPLRQGLCGQGAGRRRRERRALGRRRLQFRRLRPALGAAGLPASGVVLERRAQAGEVVQPGQAVVSVADLNSPPGAARAPARPRRRRDRHRRAGRGRRWTPCPARPWSATSPAWASRPTPAPAR